MKKKFGEPRDVKAKMIQRSEQVADVYIQIPPDVAPPPTVELDVDQAKELMESGIEEGPIKVYTPIDYSHRVIGETMLSICNTLNQMSQHDVLIMFPQLIKDVVDEAYAKGYRDARA